MFKKHKGLGLLLVYQTYIFVFLILEGLFGLFTDSHWQGGILPVTGRVFLPSAIFWGISLYQIWDIRGKKLLGLVLLGLVFDVLTSKIRLGTWFQVDLMTYVIILLVMAVLLFVTLRVVRNRT